MPDFSKLGPDECVHHVRRVRRRQALRKADRGTGLTAQGLHCPEGHRHLVRCCCCCSSSRSESA